MVALLTERWDRYRDQPDVRRYAILGLVGGLAMSMREQEALFLLPIGVDVAVRAARHRELRLFQSGVALVVGTLVAFMPQLLVWRYYTGGFHPPQIEPIRWGTPMFLVALFSTRSGLFPWSPICYASLLGILFGRGARALKAMLGTAFLLNLYVVAAAWLLSAGYSYGARRLSDSAPLIGLGVALLYDRLQTPIGRRAARGFTALCVVLCLLSMELQRFGLTRSSGGYARTAGQYLEEARLPRWSQNVADAVGYPFVQPVGWLFGLVWHVRSMAFEGVVGNFLLDRDGQWFTVLVHRLDFIRFNRGFVAAGLELGEKAPARVTGPVRLLVPMFASEPVSVQLIGKPSGRPSVTWNGQVCPVQITSAGVITFTVDAQFVRAGVNELKMDLETGSLLDALDFTPLGKTRPK
jgi:hypothetical protein